MGHVRRQQKFAQRGHLSQNGQIRIDKYDLPYLNKLPCHNRHVVIVHLTLSGAWSKGSRKKMMGKGENAFPGKNPFKSMTPDSMATY